ncbi:MAG TPA: signal peptidase I [Anaerolineales bacterium]|nr:signal peptidase I [Anaerolineales bacterium]
MLETLQPEGGVEPQSPSQVTPEWKRFLLDLLETVGLALVLFVLINSVSARVRVDGSSMLPTLHDGEFVLVNKMAYRLGAPTRGDIIVFRSTTEADLDLIKRIIGVPGDQVSIRNGHVRVNDQMLVEPYINADPNYSGEWKVPAGDLFVLGDNRNDSSDSHMWGFLPERNVIGKALLIYWPPPEWAMINHVPVAAAAP